MRIEEVKILDKARLYCYICSESPEMPNLVRDAMLVLPGGGYQMCSDREAEPIVKKYLAAGMNVFLLYYSCGADAAGFRPLVEASYAMKYIRENAKEFNIDPERVFAVGFSAGGHLCASLGTFWNAPWLKEKLSPDFPYGINKPTGTVLSYAVTSAVTVPTHLGSFYSIIGSTEPSEEDLKKYSINLHVSKDSSPAFIWATADDQAVPVINSIVVAEKMAEHGVPFEMHIFPHGPHGIALAEEETAVGWSEFIDENVAKWIPLSIIWMKGLKKG
ncbi:MAG: alpha/beta hydrolase [Clostridia bacterium]|nr:alpha/beta hydrolase [Clostridia bacterium]